ncbi:MAG TPA: amino acid racemase [Candidatus Bathyarchaeia archaeon]|nr:amino acid racemase [Candidatus Bathyarchaeia archaeon]
MNKNKNAIGIIGGVGPQATKFIYEKIIEFSQTKYGAKDNDDYPKIIIYSVPIPDFISDEKRLEQAKKMLITATKSLTKAGVTKLSIASNTVHILLPKLRKQTIIDFLSVIEITAKKCSNCGFKKVGILGSPILVKSGIYTKALRKYGIRTILPTKEELQIAEDIIRDVLAGGKDGDKKQKYIKVLNELFTRGAEAIILGCTELPLAVNYEALGNKTINSDEVLAEALTDYYYE